MFKIIQNDIFITRGDTAYINLGVRIRETKEPYDYSNDDVIFTVRKDSISKENIIQKTFHGTGIKLEKDDTIKLDYQTLKYDIELIKQNGDNFTIIANKNFTITEEEHTP